MMNGVGYSESWAASQGFYVGNTAAIPRLGLPSPVEATDEAIAAACITTTEGGQAYREHNANGTPMGAFVTRSRSGKVYPDPIAPSMVRHIRPGVLFGPEAAVNRPKL